MTNPEEENRLRESLLGPKSDTQLSVVELQEASRVFFGGEDVFHLYGLGPADLYAAGCRVVGRTAVVSATAVSLTLDHNHFL
jgi:hypothetical protein